MTYLKALLGMQKCYCHWFESGRFGLFALGDIIFLKINPLIELSFKNKNKNASSTVKK